jgi:DNA polymerase III delta subunit
MLSLYYGTDRTAARNAIHALVANASSVPTLETITADTYRSGLVSTAIGEQSLFGGETWYLFDTPSTNPEFKSDVLQLLDELAAAPGTYIVLEGVLLAADLKPFKAVTDAIEQFTAAKAERINTFALTDALLRRDRRQMWLILQQAVQAGVTEEEIVGVLWWQLKSLLLADRTKTAKEASMKEFTYNKAKRSLGAFKPGEVEQLAARLLAGFHHVRVGKGQLSDVLERWILLGR